MCVCTRGHASERERAHTTCSQGPTEGRKVSRIPWSWKHFYPLSHLPGLLLLVFSPSGRSILTRWSVFPKFLETSTILGHWCLFLIRKRNEILWTWTTKRVCLAKSYIILPFVSNTRQRVQGEHVHQMEKANCKVLSVKRMERGPNFYTQSSLSRRLHLKGKS